VPKDRPAGLCHAETGVYSGPALYIPDQLCVELKSWKIYLWSFRNEGGFHEDLTNRILDDLVAALKPRFMRLTADFNVRGGIYTTITADYRNPDGNGED
jgi:7-cyano-7-deazaguanine reductase